MVVVPADTPVTLPTASTVATVVVPLLQIPPEAASANEVTPPIHTEGVPVMAAKEPLTVTVAVAGLPQPLA